MALSSSMVVLLGGAAGAMGASGSEKDIVIGFDYCFFGGGPDLYRL